MRSPRPLAPAPFLPGEPFFDKVIAKVGGCRVDTLVRPTSENADYVIRASNVIAELKVIEKDLRKDPETTARVSEIFRSHASAPGMPIAYGRVQVRGDLLPPPARDDLLEVFKRKFEGPIKKAARQIKATRTLLGMPDAVGLLILANDRSTFAEPAMASYLLGRILRSQHTSIDHVVFCSTNMFLYSSATPEGARIWLSAPVVNRSRHLEHAFDTVLARAWQDTIDAEVGVASPRISLPIKEALDAPMRMSAPPTRGPADRFVRPGRYYRCKRTGARVYCSTVELGSTRLLLLETPGTAVSNHEIYDRKLIYATHLQFDEITDAAEVQRLALVVSALRGRA